MLDGCEKLRNLPFFFSFIIFCLLHASAQTTIVRPTEIDDVLINPGMGIETFNRFSGQALNEGVIWSEVGPEAALADAPPGTVDFPRSSPKDGLSPTTPQKLAGMRKPAPSEPRPAGPGRPRRRRRRRRWNRRPSGSSSTGFAV